VQIPILSGIFTDGGPDVRQSYPVNMLAVPGESGVSAGYLRPGEGIVELGEGPGISRGGILWLGTLYRVMGTKFVSIASDSTIVEIGDVGEGGPVSMTYSFDYLAIASGGRLYLYDGSVLTQVTDVNLGVVLSVVWIDGYFMTTDGEFLVVGDLTNPFAINPLKYGSAEASPDPIVAVLRVRNEVAAVGRTTIEFFDNVGGPLFPFQRIESAQVDKGCIGTDACCVVNDAIAFIGGGLNEAPGVFLAANANAQKISSIEVDRILAGYSEVQLAAAYLEPRNADGRVQLYVHLEDLSLMLDFTSTSELGKAVWVVLTSTAVVDTFTTYRARFFVWAYDRWNIGDPTTAKFGSMSLEIGCHFGDVVRWEFGTPMIYNESNGAVVNSLELVALTGRVALGATPTISTSYSLDGQTWSQDRAIPAGVIGNRVRRLVWFGQGLIRSRRVQRFRGDSGAHVSFQRLEAAVVPLAW
jgi:hypothetical protein